jgi:hypothetical protein
MLAAAAVAASSFLFASRAFASTALAGSSSSSCRPYVTGGFGVRGSARSEGIGRGKSSPSPPLTGSCLVSSSAGAATGAVASSASSEISFSLRRRREELEDVRDPAEGCSMADRLSAASVSSVAVVKEKTVS